MKKMNISFYVLLLVLTFSLNVHASLDYSAKTYSSHVSNQKNFEVDSYNLKYLDIGKKDSPVVLLIHGVPTNSWMYRGVIEELVKNNYRVIAPDLLGMGSSDKPKIKDLYTIKAHGDRLFALMEHLNINSWTQVIHDMAGAITWEMLENQSSSKIKKLVILNTFAFKKGFNHPPLLVAPFVSSFLKTKLGVKMTLRTMLVNKDLIKNENFVDGYFRPLKEGGSFAVSVFMKGIRKMKKKFPQYQNSIRLRGDLKTLIIWGVKDRTLRSKQIVAFQEILNVSKIVELDAGHLLMEDRPKKVSNEIINFLK